MIDSVTSTAVCNPGDIVLEGGFTIRQETGDEFNLANILNTGTTFNGQAYFIIAAGPAIVIQRNALCFDTP